MFSVAEHLMAQHGAIKMLHSRVKLILEYIKAVQSGLLLYCFNPFNPEFIIVIFIHYKPRIAVAILDL